MTKTQEITCPHCQHEFRMEMSRIEAINIACNAATYDNPEAEHFGFRFFFRGYVPSQSDMRLIGACLAYPVVGTGKFYYALAGADCAHEGRGGEEFVGWRDVPIFAEAPTEQFVQWKREAMERLILMVAEKEKDNE